MTFSMFLLTRCILLLQMCMNSQSIDFEIRIYFVLLAVTLWDGLLFRSMDRTPCLVLCLIINWCNYNFLFFFSFELLILIVHMVLLFFSFDHRLKWIIILIIIVFIFKNVFIFLFFNFLSLDFRAIFCLFSLWAFTIVRCIH